MTRYGNGMKEDVTRCSYPIGFAHKARQCLRKRRWWVYEKKIGNTTQYQWLFCKQHARQLANQHEGEW